MDLGTIIISVLALATFIVPIYLIQSRQKKKNSKVLDEFLAFCQSRQLHLTEQDSWNGNLAIGIDKAKKKLVYFNRHSTIAEHLVVDLAGVSKCEVVNVSREVNGNLLIDGIELHLAFVDGKKPQQKLEFYNKEHFTMLSGELQLARKWADHVNAATRSSLQPARV
jgi:hypothetical protein